MCTLAWILVAVLALSSPSAGAACACGNGGTSIAEPDSNECMCHCAAGFTGDTCAQTISESCSSNPCMNNAPCSGLGIGDFTGGTNSTNFAKHTVGLRFKTTESIVVTHLGSHDFLGSGLLTDRTVGLWDSGGNLLASTVLEAGAGAPLRGGYRLKKLANSITLKANKEFSIGQRSATTYQYKWQLERLITHPSVLWVGARVSTQTTFANPTDDSYNYFGRLTATFVVAGDTYGTYVCDCPSGYTGSQCDVNINPCGSSPCENGASCIDDVNGYTCSCAAGYSGDKCQNDIDECASVPCQNSATCVDGVDGFTCSCTAGYDGTLCNNNIDECASAPCQNGASCTDGVDGYTCTCALGYNGVECQTNINECASNPCENGATCTDAVNGFTCACVSGYDGTMCDNDINECASSPCENGASCIDDVNGYTCSCAAGYSGDKCQNDIDECASVPCQNSATCVDGVDGFTCTCAGGFDGTLCDNDIDECASAPCQNGATCVDAVDGFLCSCTAGYVGTLCDNNIDECASAPCQNGASCTDGVDGYTCTCALGYNGVECQTNINECASNPCENGATCTDAVNGFTCACASGYDGTMCDNDIDECASSPCENGASCIDDVNGYTCSCAAGYSGDKCQNNIDECASVPCQNSATCVDGVDGFTCTCAGGFDGTLCDNDIDECASAPCQNGASCIDGVNGFLCACVSGYTSTLCESDIDECASSPCGEALACVNGVDGYTCVTIESILSTSNAQIASASQPAVESASESLATVMAVPAAASNSSIVNSVLESIDATAATAFAGTSSTVQNNMFNTVEEAMDAPAAGAAHTVATAKNVTAPGRVVERVARSILDATQSCATVTSATQSSQGGKFNATTRRGPSASLSDATLSASGSSIRVPSSLATYLGTLSACTQVHIAKIAKASLLSSDAAGTATTGMLVSSVTSVGFADESVSFAGAADPLEITVELSGSLTAAEVSRVRCVYWDFASVSWSGEGCTVQSRSAVAVTCACSHTTNFAVLLDPSTTVSRSTAAMVTSYFSSGIVLVASLTVVIVFLLLPKTFRTAPTRVLMFICGVQAVQQTVFMVDLGAAKSFGDAACFVTGLLLHYFTLVLFLLFACYGYLVFSMLVKMDAHLRKLARRLILFAVLTPILVVAIYTAVASMLAGSGLTAYTKSASGFCYLSSSVGVYAAVVAPLGLTMIWNLTIICLMLHRLVDVRRAKVIKASKRAQNATVKLFVLLSCALGLSWLMGLITVVWDSPLADYLFCLASVVQACILVIGYCATRRVRHALSSHSTRTTQPSKSKTTKSKSKSSRRTPDVPTHNEADDGDEFVIPESGITMLDMVENYGAESSLELTSSKLDSPHTTPTALRRWSRVDVKDANRVRRPSAVFTSHSASKLNYVSLAAQSPPLSPHSLVRTPLSSPASSLPTLPTLPESVYHNQWLNDEEAGAFEAFSSMHL